MQIGITFDEQLLTSRQHAHFYNLFLNHTDGITKGCDLTYTNNYVYIQKGFFVASGRFVEVTGVETIETPTVASGTLYCKVVYEIDLTKENTESEFNQGYFTVLSSASGYPTTTREDLDDDGTFYQMEFCQFAKTVSGISSFVDLRPIMDVESVYAAVADNNSAYKAEFDEYYAQEREAIEKLVDDLKEMSFVTVEDARKIIEVTLATGDWQGSSAPYTQTVNIDGITDATIFDVGILFPDNCSRTNQKNINKASSYIYQIESGANQVTFRATAKPSVDIPLGLKGVI